MVLVDKEIKARASEIFLENCYEEQNVTAISYDLHIRKIIAGENTVDAYDLRPNEFIYVETVEKIKMPLDLMGVIGEKNSRMRQGLNVAGPHYYPGHQTRIFLRVQNISSCNIKIKESDSIAQLFFEKLDQIPEKPYNQQINASFNDEDVYRGFGRYKDEYEERMNIVVERANEQIEDKINNIYANILTIMGIFVSIFSLITVNFTNVNNNMTLGYIIPINISLGIVISLFIGLILIFLNKLNSKKCFIAYFGFIALLIIGLFFSLGGWNILADFINKIK